MACFSCARTYVDDFLLFMVILFTRHRYEPPFKFFFLSYYVLRSEFL